MDVLPVLQCHSNVCDFVTDDGILMWHEIFKNGGMNCCAAVWSTISNHVAQWKHTMLLMCNASQETDCNALPLQLIYDERCCPGPLWLICGCHPQHRWCLENQFSNEAVSHSLHFNSSCWHLDVAAADHIQCNALQVSMTTAWIVLFAMLKRSPTLWYDFSVPSIHRVARTLVSTEWFLSVKLGARTLHDSYILHSSFPVITEYISTTPLSVKQNKKLSTDINL